MHVMTDRRSGYAEDTEFLSTSGWRAFDRIGASEPVATLSRSGELEFEVPTAALDTPYCGDIHVWRVRHSESAVTPSVRMCVAAVRNRNRVGGPRSRHPFRLASSAELLSGQRSYFEVCLAARPRSAEHAVDDLLIIATGCYVTEGCVGKRLQDGSPSVLRLSQKVGGNLDPFLAKLKAAWPKAVRTYMYERAEDWRLTSCPERVVTISDRALAKRVIEECGERKGKHLPAWAFRLSARQARLLMDVLMAGDGTAKRDYRVYYSSSTRLAGDVQALALSAGFASEVWGPYAGMHQVFVGERRTTGTVVARPGQAVTIARYEGRVVSFAVANPVLVTRREGRVGLHGGAAAVSALGAQNDVRADVAQLADAPVSETGR